MDKKPRKNRRLSHDYDYNSSDSDSSYKARSNSSYKVRSNDVLCHEADRNKSIKKPIAISSFQNNALERNNDISERFKNKKENLEHKIKMKNHFRTDLPGNMLFKIINNSCQQLATSDSKKRRCSSAEPEIQHKNRRIDEMDSKIKRIRFGDPSSSRQVVRFEENIPYSSDHKNAASKETIISSNGVSCQQPGRSDSKNRRCLSVEPESQHKYRRIDEMDITKKRIRFGDPSSSRQVVRFEENIPYSSDPKNGASKETIISSNGVSCQQPGRSDSKNRRCLSVEPESQHKNRRIDEMDITKKRIRFGVPSSSKQVVRFEENIPYSSDPKNGASKETIISSNGVSCQQPGRSDSKNRRCLSVEPESQHKNRRIDEMDITKKRIRFGDPSSSRQVVRFEENIPYSSDHKNAASKETIISSNGVSCQQPGRSDSKNRRCLSVEPESQHKYRRIDEMDITKKRIRFGDPSSSRQVVRFEENIPYSSDHKNNASNETIISSNGVSCQQPGRSDSKKIHFSSEPESQHKNRRIDEIGSKIKRIRFGDPSSSRPIVRFVENIPYSSDHEKNASNKKMIRNNGVSCEQPGGTDKKKPTSILWTRFHKKKTRRGLKKQVKFNCSPVCKSRAEKDDLSSDKQDSTVIKSTDHGHLYQRPGGSDEHRDSDGRYSNLYGYKICDTSKVYFGLKIAKTDIKILQYKVRLQNPKSFVIYLKEQVSAIKISIKKELGSSLIQSLITKLCTSQFIHGDCQKRRCQFAHELPMDKCYQLEDSLRLALLTTILNQCKQPSIWLGRSILDWLRKELKYVYEILLISEYFLSFDDTKYKTIWKVILKSLVACGLEEWQAVSWILIYYYKEDEIDIVQNLIKYLDIENRIYSYYWKSVRPLTQLGFVLTEGIIKQILTQICSDPKKIKCFSKESISEINFQVERLSLQSTFNLLSLIENFVGIQKKALIEANNMPVKYDIISHLIPAMGIKDIASITKTVIDYSKTIEYKEAIAKLIVELMPFGRACYLIEAVIQETYNNNEGENARSVMERVGVTCMLSSSENKDWKNAYDLLLLLKKSGINPITTQPLDLAFSEVNILLACSKIYFYNSDYHSSIIILSDNNILTNDSTAWGIKGSPSEFELIVDHVWSLQRTFNSKQMIKEAKLLFSKILTSQKSLSTPIDLLEFYEPLLCSMLYQVEEYRDQIIPFYKEVDLIDSSLMLNPFSYRALVALSYQNKELSFAKEMVKNAIKCFVYNPFDKEENAIYIAPYMVVEEMMIYLLEWVHWYNQNDKCPDVQLHVKFIEPSTTHSQSNDFLVSPLLSLTDHTLAAAVNRFVDGIEVLIQTPIARPKKRTNSLTLAKPLFKFLSHSST